MCTLWSFPPEPCLIRIDTAHSLVGVSALLFAPMSAEFVSISTSSFDPAALAAQLTEHSAQGWSVVSIVPTGGDVTAFLTREAAAEEAAAEEAAAKAPAEAAHVAAAPVVEAAAAAAVAEPAGWAVAPDTAPLAPIAEAPPAYTSTPAYAPAPAPAYNPAPAAPAVPSGWYADPAGRFELRYWDGSAWTEHVSRAGQQFTDAPVA